MTRKLRFMKLPGVFLLALCLAAAAQACPLHEQAETPALETVAAVQEPPGNITVSPQGRVFVSMHQFFSPSLRMAEVKDGALVPFPTEALARGEEEDGLRLDAILGVKADRHGVVWMLDNGLRSATPPKLVGWDSLRGRLHRVVDLASVSLPTSFLNDLVVDRAASIAVIADPAKGKDAALIVLDLATGKARRVLQGHVSVVGQGAPMRVGGRTLAQGGVEANIGVNPIAIDAASEYVYYGPMSAEALYRIPLAALRDEGLDGPSLAAQAKKVGERPVSDGAEMDAAGNVYVTAVTRDEIGYVSADGAYRTLVRDEEKLRWPDSLAIAPDGAFLYILANQLDRSPPLNEGKDEAARPFTIYRHPLAPLRP